MVKKLIITACVEAVLLTLAALVDPLFLKENAVWVIVAAMSVLLLVALYDWIRSQGAVESKATGSGQSTQGDAAHAVGVVHGDFIVNPPAPAIQERKGAGGYKLTRENLAALNRIAGGVSATRSFDDLLDGHKPRQGCPEMPIWEALLLIANRIGDKDAVGGFPEARRQFRQAAVDHRVEVWGQKDIPPAHMKDERHKSIWTAIEPDYWEHYELNSLSASKEHDGKWHTEEEELPGTRGYRHWSLRVRPQDINRRWPSQHRPEADDDGYDWKTV